MNNPIAVLRWKYDEEKTLNAAHYVYRVPFRAKQVGQIEFYRKITQEEAACFAPCLEGGGKWRMVGETEWREGDLTEAISNG